MLKIGDWGFELRALGITAHAYSRDVELNVGPFGVTLLPDGLFLRGRSTERSWRWFEVQAWFSTLGLKTAGSA